MPVSISGSLHAVYFPIPFTPQDISSASPSIQIKGKMPPNFSNSFSVLKKMYAFKGVLSYIIDPSNQEVFLFQAERSPKQSKTFIDKVSSALILMPENDYLGAFNGVHLPEIVSCESALSKLKEQGGTTILFKPNETEPAHWITA